MKTDITRDLLFDELADIHDAEKQLVAALPKMAEAAHNSQLKDLFKKHLEETKNQVERLEKVHTKLGKSGGGSQKNKSCPAMKALIAEGEAIAGMEGNDDVIDAAIIGAAQRIEHYEIAAYGCACAFARLAGEEEVARLLDESLNEEHAADAKLSDAAESLINPRAAGRQSQPQRSSRARQHS